MKTTTVWPTILACLVAVMLTAAPAFAQEITGVPGSPSATEAIDGKYLPPPPPKFSGEITLGAEPSKPYGPPTVGPPKGTPNVLLIMTDDAGDGVSGPFGASLRRRRWREQPKAAVDGLGSRTGARRCDGG
jgi:hypothetical protein